jgi:hypothetical protein
MGSNGSREGEARRNAQALWNKKQQRKVEAVGHAEKERRAEADKTARLRALRLAKEAQDKEAKAGKGPPGKAASRKGGGGTGGDPTSD